MKNIFTLSIATIVSLFLTIGGYSQTYYVDAAQPNNFGAGTSWTTAKKDLQAALNIAPFNSQIWVKNGIYKPTQDPSGNPNPANPRNKTFYVLDGLKIYGGFIGNETALNQRNIATNTTTLSGDIGIPADASDNSYHVVLASANSVSGVGVTVDGFTITGGNANTISTIYVNLNSIDNNAGGGIYTAYGTNTIANNIITGNSTSFFGGGIYTYYGTITITKNMISGNTGGLSGGIHAKTTQQSGNNVTNNIVSGNSGWGIQADLGYITITNNLINGNYGGGVHFLGTNAILANNTITNNVANAGGGLFTESGNNTITNNIFWGNKTGTSTTAQYADYYNFSSTNTFSNNVLQLASATYSGYSALGTASGNIFAQNPLFVNESNIAGLDGTILTADDGLVLQTGSPAFHAGTATGAPANDILGNTRSTTTPTIGAYEKVAPNTLYVDANITNSGDGTSWANAYKTLDEALYFAWKSPLIVLINVARGTYKPTKKPYEMAMNMTGTEITTSDARDVSFHIRPGLTVKGGFPNGGGVQSITSNLTILSGDIGIDGSIADNAYHVIFMDNSNNWTKPINLITLDGFTITGGNANLGGSITVNSNPIYQRYGAGIYTLLSNNTITNNLILDNSADYFGGGIYCFSGTNTFNNNSVLNNTAISSGGGIYTYYGNNTYNNNTISGNTTGYGGGISSYEGTNLLANNTIVGNTASGSDGGGGIFSTGTNTLTNNIFWGNKKGSSATEAFADFNSFSTSNTFKNNLFQLVNSNYTAFTSLGISSNNLFVTDPLLVNANNVVGPDGINHTSDDGLALSGCSPVINAGTDSGLTTDILGSARVGAYDMGAYEYQSNISKMAPEVGSQFASSIEIQSSSSITFYNVCINNLITRVLGSGANPITGTTTAKVWVETTQPTQFVKRHYEITPDNNAPTATGRITLYFTQAEFTAYNSQLPAPTNLLPSGPADATGIANLRIEKYSGTSSDGTGLPNTYTGTAVIIDPDDNSIQWNAPASRWQVNFDVVGFSGFFVKTQSATPLPVSILSFTGKTFENYNQLNWQTANENGFSHFEIERSNQITNEKFVKIGEVKGNSEGNYSFDDAQHQASNVQHLFYRLKMVDIDGQYSYSKIIALQNKENHLSKISPNPSILQTKLTVGLGLLNSEAFLLNASGRVLKTIKITSLETSIITADLVPGTYFLKLKNGETLKFLKE